MNRSEKSRHPLFENVVFGLALLLVVILGFYGARRFLARRSAVPPPLAGPLAAELPPEPAQAMGSRTQSAVTAIPPIKLSRTGSARQWRVEVPAPTGVKKK